MTHKSVMNRETGFRLLDDAELAIVSGGGDDEDEEPAPEPIVVTGNKITDTFGGGGGGVISIPPVWYFGGFDGPSAPYGPPNDPLEGLEEENPEDDESQYRVPGDPPSLGITPVDVSRPINTQASSPPALVSTPRIINGPGFDLGGGLTGGPAFVGPITNPSGPGIFIEVEF